ncbi:MAG: type VI secretion system baseplate subunit TssE [Myxococcales bacterium]|nr:type VI secretion system baseplate subunit TssE [Myxococcales bacterium]
MGDRGLLSRLGTRRTASHSVDPASAVVAHLRVLLNARQGEAPATPDYGIPDFTDIVHSIPAGIGPLQRAIRDTIHQFEPRLKSVQVRHLADDGALHLHFEITGRLVGDNRMLKLQTRMTPGGKVDVR